VYVSAGVMSGVNRLSAPPSNRYEDRKSTVVDLTNWTTLRGIWRYRRQTSRPATASYRQDFQAAAAERWVNSERRQSGYEATGVVSSD